MVNLIKARNNLKDLIHLIYNAIVSVYLEV